MIFTAELEELVKTATSKFGLNEPKTFRINLHIIKDPIKIVSFYIPKTAKSVVIISSYNNEKNAKNLKEEINRKYLGTMVTYILSNTLKEDEILILWT